MVSPGLQVNKSVELEVDTSYICYSCIFFLKFELTYVLLSNARCIVGSWMHNGCLNCLLSHFGNLL